uniref:AAA-ATPase-like domain-containing protein n=1 Tax=Cacopsylla melanoneura TaxID=428564 RepID=A0A8D8U3T9_9HEMI
MSGYALCLILVLTALESFCKATENVQGLNKESEEEHNPLTEDKSHLTEHKDDEGREEHKINEEDENVSFGNETYVFNKQDEKRELYKANVLSSSFDKVATAGVLIDKSYVIKEMFKVKKKVILLTRPPRWGKSLTLDMIKAFLDVEVDNMGSKIAPSLLTKPKMFHGSSYDVDNIGYKRLKVSNSGICKKMCEYPVIHLDLGDIDGYNESQILWNMYDKIDEVFQKQFPYLNETNFLNGLSEENDIKLRLERFTGRGTVEYSEFKKSITFLSNVLSKIYNNDPVILIDNYDKSLLNLYLKYGPNHESSVTLRKALEDLLKKTLRHNPHVRKAFVTGVFPCAKYDLLNKVDLLDSNVFNQYFGRDFGFNEEEVIELVGHLPGHKVESIMDFYPGYCHGNQSHLFNPYSVMQVLLNKGAIKPYWPNKEDVQVFNKALKMYFKQDYKVLMAGKVLPNLYLSQKLKLSEIIEPENLLEMLIYNGYLSARPSHTKVIPMKKKALGLKMGGPDKNKNETLMATITFHNVSIPNQEILMAFHKIIRKEKRDKKKETENEAEE